MEGCSGSATPKSNGVKNGVMNGHHEETKAGAQPPNGKTGKDKDDDALSETSEVEMIELEDDDDGDNAEMT